MIGKLLTLRKGLVVTVVRRASPWSHIVRADHTGAEHEIIDRVLRDTPRTYRRDTL